MTPAEATTLIALIAAITGERPAEGAPDAWAYILNDVAIADALAAARTIARTPPPHDRRLTITPDQILTQIKKEKQKNLATAPEFTPTLGCTPKQYLNQYRQYIKNAANGTPHHANQIEKPKANCDN